MIVRSTRDDDADLESLIDEAVRSHEPIHLTGKRGKVVLLSEDDWRSVEATLHLHSVPGLVDSINKADAEPRDSYTDLKDVEW